MANSELIMMLTKKRFCHRILSDAVLMYGASSECEVESGLQLRGRILQQATKGMSLRMRDAISSRIAETWDHLPALAHTVIRTVSKKTFAKGSKETCLTSRSQVFPPGPR